MYELMPLEMQQQHFHLCTKDAVNGRCVHTRHVVLDAEDPFLTQLEIQEQLLEALAIACLPEPCVLGHQQVARAPPPSHQ